MPKWWFYSSIKVVAPVCLVIFFGWQFVSLIQTGFRYDKSYDLAAEIIGGWLVTILVFASGFIVKLICDKTKYGIEIKKLEESEPTWDELTALENGEETSDSIEVKEEAIVIEEASDLDKVESE